MTAKNIQGQGRVLWVFMSTTVLEIFSLHKDISIQIFSAFAVISSLSVEVTQTVKIHGHVVIYLSGSRLYLPIDSSITTPH